MAFRDKAKDGTTRITGGAAVSNVLDVYPIGTIHLTVNPANPSTYFGGTWAAWGTGRMPIGVDTGQTEFDTVEETGGNKVKPVPAHTHSTPNHTHTDNFATATAALGLVSNTTTGGSSDRLTGAGSGTHNHAMTGGITSSGSGTTGAAAGSDFDVMNPYITCYMWKRTA